MNKIGLILGLLSMSATSAVAGSCADYPYSTHIDVIAVPGGTKILSTASSAVAMDDVDSINDARDEAMMEAKAQIAHFLEEEIADDKKIDKVVKESKKSDGQSVKVSRDELITRVKSLRNSSKALLRGVVPLGNCYTKGREFRVTVGIKPETIQAAEGLAGSVSNSLANQKTPQKGQLNNSKAASAKAGSDNAANQINDSPALPLRGMDDHSDSRKIQDF